MHAPPPLVMAVLGLDPRINTAIPMRWLLTGIASFVKCARVERQAIPATMELESQSFRRLV
jgi:hypothetical protein